MTQVKFKCDKTATNNLYYQFDADYLLNWVFFYEVSKKKRNMSIRMSQSPVWCPHTSRFVDRQSKIQIHAASHWHKTKKCSKSSNLIKLKPLHFWVFLLEKWLNWLISNQDNFLLLHYHNTVNQCVSRDDIYLS